MDLGLTSHFEPAAPAAFGELPRLATAYYSIAHSAADHDLVVKVGVSYLRDPSHADFVVVGPGEATQDSVRLTFPGSPNTARSTPGNTEHFWSLGFTSLDNVSRFLPLGNSNPWFLNVAEGG